MSTSLSNPCALLLEHGMPIEGTDKDRLLDLPRIPNRLRRCRSCPCAPHSLAHAGVNRIQNSQCQKIFTMWKLLRVSQLWFEVRQGQGYSDEFEKGMNGFEWEVFTRDYQASIHNSSILSPLSHANPLMPSLPGRRASHAEHPHSSIDA